MFIMNSLTTWAFLTRIFFEGTNAQNGTMGTCEDVKSIARPWNSSTTRQIPALRLEGENPRGAKSVPDGRYTLVNDSSKIWELSLRVQPEVWANGTSPPEPKDLRYEQHVFLGTKDSNTTDVGSCHQIM
jgi:hypothetical protein